MNRGFFPIFLIVLAIGLFVFYTDSAYQGTKDLRTTLASHETALMQSEQVVALRDRLLNERNNFPPEGINRLQAMLPDNIDNIRLIININDIATRHHMQVQGISIGGQSNDSSGNAASQGLGATAMSVGPGAAAVGSVTLGFSVDATYTEFLSFLYDLEHSLRLIDVSQISFTSGGKGVDSYSISIRTYWLK